MKNLLLMAIGIAFILGCIYLFINKPAPSQYQEQTSIVKETSSSTPYLRIGEETIQVELANTPETRTLGLSGREALQEGSGLLFLFDSPAKYGFWMKDMKFSIDIVWIDENWVVVDINKNVKPETYPEKFSPKTPAKYVLEVPAGTVEQKYIDIGQEVFLIDQN